jgi:hypothetical protein
MSNRDHQNRVASGDRRPSPTNRVEIAVRRSQNRRSRIRRSQILRQRNASDVQNQLGQHLRGPIRSTTTLRYPLGRRPLRKSPNADAVEAVNNKKDGSSNLADQADCPSKFGSGQKKQLPINTQHTTNQEITIGKNQNTFAKRQREMDKKRKAEDKKKKKAERKLALERGDTETDTSLNEDGTPIDEASADDSSADETS